MVVSIPENLPLDVALQQAIAHHKAGRLQEAEQLYRAILQAQPGQADANHNLGVLATQIGQHAAGLSYLKTALAVNPNNAQYLMSCANAQQALGQLDEAVVSYRKALAIKPDYAEACNNLGGALQALGQLDAAVASYRRALEINPGYADAQYNLGAALQALGQLDGSMPAAINVAAKPEAPTSDDMSQLVALFNARHYAEMEDQARSLIERYPDSGFAWKALGTSLLAKGEDALAALGRAAEFSPQDAEVHNNLGMVLGGLGQFDGAVASCRQALAIKRDFAEAHNNLGIAQQGLQQFDNAVASFRHALAIKRDFAEAHNNLGIAQRDLQQFDNAVGSFRRALEIKADYADAYSNLLFLYAHRSLISPEDYLAQARNWERACVPEAERAAARRRVFQRLGLAGQRLRVGYVSGDYRLQAVSYFIEPLFVHHDRTRVELFAYSTNGHRDAVTERLQSLVEHWVPVMGLSDARLRERIEADGIDVLVDLSGHTAHNRLGVFARRAAPVQVYYIGYFASTGLTEMDYLIGDAVLTPPETDGHFSERVWRLPRVWASYNGKAEAPVSAWRPTEGVIWLGSFNGLGKLTAATLALWAKVLQALPQAKLLLKTKEFSEMGNRQGVLEIMTGHGIEAQRIEFQDWSATPDWPSHMAYYDRLDIALDPVGGMGGGNTTCDALWMGAPVITLEGDRLASRVTDTMLHAAGHPEWVARSEADYIDKVVALARDVEQRTVLRSSQRERMAASPLCDARGLAKSLEDAYAAMFERWSLGETASPGQA